MLNARWHSALLFIHCSAFIGCDSSLVGKVEIPFILCMNKTYMNNRVLF